MYLVGLRGQQNQAGVRLRIAQILFSIDSGFRKFNLVEESSNKKLGRILEGTIGCLFEEDIVDIARVYSGQSREELLECLVVDKLRGVFFP